MTNAEEDIIKRYMKVSTAARLKGCAAGIIYSDLQRGRIRGLCVDGAWLVERASLEAEIARQRANAHESSAA